MKKLILALAVAAGLAAASIATGPWGASADPQSAFYLCVLKHIEKAHSDQAAVYVATASGKLNGQGG